MHIIYEVYLTRCDQIVGGTEKKQIDRIKLERKKGEGGRKRDLLLMKRRKEKAKYRERERQKQATKAQRKKESEKERNESPRSTVTNQAEASSR